MTLFQLLLSRSPWKGFASFGRIMLSFRGTRLPRYRNAVAGFTRDEDIVHMPGGVIIISPAPMSQAMLNADSRQIGWNWPSMSSRQHQLGQVEITIARTITASSKNAPTPASRQRRVQALEFTHILASEIKGPFRSPQLNGQSSSAPRDWIFAACHIVEFI